MATDKIRKRLPPYVSYRTFRNFVERLEQQVPARIDRSYWGDMLSGSTGTQLVAALHFLGLIDINGRPTARLKSLASARDEQRTGLLREMTSESFSFIFQSSSDPQNATYSQLEEMFHDSFQLTDNVCRKCIKFFVSLASEAEIPLSPFVIKRIRAAHSDSGTKTLSKRKMVRTKKNAKIPQDSEEIPESMSWNRMLLTKFPAFDPTWNDDVKLKWFAAFDELLKRAFQRGEE